MKGERDFLQQLFGLEGKTAVVTGSGGYLCSEMALALARSGCNVCFVDIRGEKIGKILEENKELDPKLTAAIVADVSSKMGVDKVLDAAVERFGKIDILINGAGINSPKPFLEIELADWEEVVRSQITSTFLCCQAFGKHMLSAGSGSIINISSASAGPPLSKAFAYSVSKAGIKNLTQNLGREWGAKGVRVNAIRPGFFPTEWNKKNFITKERHNAIIGHTPMGRYGVPEELTGAVIWLASGASSFVTGAEIAVDGGFSCMSI